MSTYARVLMLTGAAVLSYDGLMALLSRQMGFDYGSGVVGSLLIYAAAGFFGTRARTAVDSGLLAGAFAGLVDGTLGWALSTAIGPRIQQIETNSPGIFVVVWMVTLLGAVCGFVGGMVGRRR
ncbi:MAG TPA: hypothetical protein VGC13_06035 [Longimicrobium sp.]|jgi:hypothetical protein|uniref:hypothetical protein n=1 Tax=Longimicrobium sp. TaxID=2029185 RepID=UPI002ED7E923